MFATAGIPLSTAPRNTLNGIKQVRELSLNGMELEFVRSINISSELAPKVKKTAIENSVALTCHASYYINLNSKEKKKRKASKKRILNAAQRAKQCGAQSVVFHPAFYQKMEPSKVYERVKESLVEIIEELQSKNNSIWIRPETTGKRSQFGSFEEILSLSQELEQVMPCIDFSHLHARNNGKINSFKEFSSLLERMEEKLGEKALKKMHCHVSGIDYSEKGERKHLNLKESDFNYPALIKALKEFNCSGIIVSESPNIEKDALLLKEEYQKLRKQ